MANVVYAPAFAHDLENDVQYLRRLGELGWIATLAEDLEQLERMLAHFPLAGTKHAERETWLLLRMRTRRAPFYVWYTYNAASGPDGEVRFLRLFHVRQQAPEIRFP
jgi:plasmid stabilization system protein ParE